MGEISDRVRRYAMGKRDIKNYKELMTSGPSYDFVSIDWKLPKIIKTKVLKKITQTIKNYKMVLRLKQNNTLNH